MTIRISRLLVSVNTKLKILIKKIAKLIVEKKEVVNGIILFLEEVHVCLYPLHNNQMSFLKKVISQLNR
jgi:hypothetical protein